MITAVTSTSAANSTAAAARNTVEEPARRPEADSQAVAVPAPAPVRTESAVVTISAEAASQAAFQAVAQTRTIQTAAPTKPDWSFAPPDNNKDGRITYFEQQFYDFRNYPDSLKEVLAAQADADTARAASPAPAPAPAPAAAELKAYEDVARAGRNER